MSLFADENYQWRETYFVLFDQRNRPTAERVKIELSKLGPHYELQEVRATEEGLLESLTLISPDDYAAMDIVFVAGEEVTEQAVALKNDMMNSDATTAEKEKLEKLKQCDGRFDIFHFEQMVFNGATEVEDEFMDPGALLIVLEGFTRLCDGVSVDPQSGSLL